MIKARQHSAGFFFVLVLFLLLFFAARLPGLEALPLHNDEGLHLTRAVEVWNGNPFWEIRDGKIINHWLIAAFYPQHAPAFVGRIATVFVAMLGFAAVLGMTRRLGVSAVALGALLWLCSPFMFFYDRMAFSDMQAGALGLLALWAALQPQARSARRAPASTPLIAFAAWHLPSLLTGIILALALLFKFTAAPYALGVALLVLMRREPLRQRLGALAIISAVVAAAFAVPILVLLSRGSSLFDIALAWVGVGGGGSSGQLTLFDNLGRLETLLTWRTAYWDFILWSGVFAVVLLGRGKEVGLALVGALPLIAILILGRDAQSRHFAAALPPLVVVAAVGWGRLTQPKRLPSDKAIRPKAQVFFKAAQGIVFLLLPFMFIPFAINAYRDPASLGMPPLMAAQYITGYASGYGLREAVEAFPETLPNRQLQVVASMYGDSCRRANFYARDRRRMLCGDAPMRAAIEAALARDGAVYVLVERGGDIGIDVLALDAQAALLGVYPRPGETGATASVRLWRLER